MLFRSIFNNGNQYSGSLKNGKPNGYGVWTKSNGERYEGEWENGFKNGKGVIWYNDGERYEGDFVYDCKEGFGKQFLYFFVYYRPNGRTGEGNWVNGKQQGIFTLRIPDKGVFKFPFENGSPDNKSRVIRLQLDSNS